MPDIFAVIADGTRRDLLQLLLERRTDSETGEWSVGEMVDHLGLSQPTVSKHLKVLRDNHLVRVREDGQHRYYSVRPDELKAVDAWLRPFLDGGADETDPASDPTRDLDREAWPTATTTRRIDAGHAPVAAAGASLGRGAADAMHAARTLGADVVGAVRRLVAGVSGGRDAR